MSNFVSIDESTLGDIPQLCPEENVVLTTHFTEKEVHEAIAQMKNNKAPVLDGFPMEFYQKCSR